MLNQCLELLKEWFRVTPETWGLLYMVGEEVIWISSRQGSPPLKYQLYTFVVLLDPTLYVANRLKVAWNAFDHMRLVHQLYLLILDL